MSKLIVLIGPSGSGKTTWSKNYIRRTPNTVRVSRDNVREGILGKLTSEYYKRKDFSTLEKQVSIIVNNQVRHFLQHGYRVILDNTHLKQKYITEIITEFSYLTDIELKIRENINLETCIKRVKKREDSRTFLEKIYKSNSVDTSYIKKQYEDFIKIKQLFRDGQLFPKCNYTYELVDPLNILQECIICDLDGTLALFGDKNPYDRDFENDNVNIPLLNILKNSQEDGINIIFLSGRDSKFRVQTEKFLNKYILNYQLYMRKEKDMRNDAIIKEELFNNHIKNKYNVTCVFDDRNRILRLWNKLGLYVFSCNQDQKEF